MKDTRSFLDGSLGPTSRLEGNPRSLDRALNIRTLGQADFRKLFTGRGIQRTKGLSARAVHPRAADIKPLPALQPARHLTGNFHWGGAYDAFFEVGKICKTQTHLVATTFISMEIFPGRPATATVVRAGRCV